MCTIGRDDTAARGSEGAAAGSRCAGPVAGPAAPASTDALRQLATQPGSKRVTKVMVEEVGAPRRSNRLKSRGKGR